MNARRRVPDGKLPPALVCVGILLTVTSSHYTWWRGQDPEVFCIFNWIFVRSPDTVDRTENYPRHLSASEFNGTVTSWHIMVAGTSTWMFSCTEMFHWMFVRMYGMVNLTKTSLSAHLNSRYSDAMAHGGGGARTGRGSPAQHRQDSTCAAQKQQTTSCRPKTAPTARLL